MISFLPQEEITTVMQKSRGAKVWLCLSVHAWNIFTRKFDKAHRLNQFTSLFSVQDNEIVNGFHNAYANNTLCFSWKKKCYIGFLESLSLIGKIFVSKHFWKASKIFCLIMIISGGRRHVIPIIYRCNLFNRTWMNNVMLGILNTTKRKKKKKKN